MCTYCVDANDRWFGSEPNNTYMMQRVQVDSDGIRTKPFQMRKLVHALHTKFDQKDSYNIWIIGDSTQFQVYYGMFCGLVRIGTSHGALCARYLVTLEFLDVTNSYFNLIRNTALPKFYLGCRRVPLFYTLP